MTSLPILPCVLQLQEEVYEEAAKYGNVAGVYVATPTAGVQDLMPGRCYIKYGSPEEAAKGGWVRGQAHGCSGGVLGGWGLEWRVV